MAGTLQNHATVTPINDKVKCLCRYKQEIYYFSSMGLIYRSLDNGVNFSYFLDAEFVNLSMGMRVNANYIVILGGNYVTIFNKITKRQIKRISINITYGYEYESKMTILDDYFIIGDYVIELKTGTLKTCSWIDAFTAVQDGTIIHSYYRSLSVETIDTSLKYTVKVHEITYDFVNGTIKDSIIKTKYITLPSTLSAYFTMLSDSIVFVRQGTSFYFYNLDTETFMSDLIIQDPEYYNAYLNNIGSGIVLCSVNNNGIYTYNLYCGKTCLYECESTKTDVYTPIESTDDEYMSIYNPSTNEIITIKIAQLKESNVFSICEFVTDDKTAYLKIKENVINGGIYNIPIKEKVYYGSKLQINENIKTYINQNKDIILKEKIIDYTHANNKISSWERVKLKPGEFIVETKKIRLEEKVDPPYNKNLSIKEVIKQKQQPIITIESLSGKYTIDEYNAFSEPAIVSMNYTIKSSYVLAGPRAIYDKITSGDADYKSYPYKASFSLPYSGKTRYLLINNNVKKEHIDEYVKYGAILYMETKTSISKLSSNDFKVYDTKSRKYIPYLNIKTYNNAQYYVYPLPNIQLDLEITVSDYSLITMQKNSVKLMTSDSGDDLLNINENITAFSRRIRNKEDIYKSLSFKYNGDYLDQPVHIPLDSGAKVQLNSTLGKNTKCFFDIGYDDACEYDFSIGLHYYGGEKTIRIKNENLTEYTVIYLGSNNKKIEKISRAKGFILEFEDFIDSFTISNRMNSTSFDCSHVYFFNVSSENFTEFGTESLFMSEAIETQAAELDIKEKIIDYIPGYRCLSNIGEDIYKQGTKFGNGEIKISEYADGLHGKVLFPRVRENIPVYDVDDDYIFNDLYKVDYKYYYEYIKYGAGYYEIIPVPFSIKYKMYKNEAYFVKVNKNNTNISFHTLYSMKLQSLQDVESIDILIGYDEVELRKVKNHKMVIENSLIKIQHLTTVDCKYGWNNYEFLSQLSYFVNWRLNQNPPLEYEPDYDKTHRIKYFGFMLNYKNVKAFTPSSSDIRNEEKIADLAIPKKYDNLNPRLIEASKDKECFEFRDVFAYKKSVNLHKEEMILEKVVNGISDELRGVFFPNLDYGKPITIWNEQECIEILNATSLHTTYFSPRRVYIVTNKPITSVYGLKLEYDLSLIKNDHGWDSVWGAKEKIYNYTGYENHYREVDGKYYYDFSLYEMNGGAVDDRISSLFVGFNSKENVGENFKSYSVIIYECTVWLNGYMKNEKIKCVDHVYAYLPSANCYLYEKIIQPAANLPVKEFYTKDRGGTRILSMTERIIRPNDKIGNKSLNTKENVKPFRYHRDLDVTELVPCEPIKDGIWIYENTIKDTKTDVPIKEKVVNIKKGKDAKVMVEIVKH